jgi:hypothetical protein
MGSIFFIRSEKAPKTGASAGDFLNYQVDQGAYHKQGQAQVQQSPQQSHPGQAGLWNAVAQNGLGRRALKYPSNQGHGLFQLCQGILVA